MAIALDVATVMGAHSTAASFNFTHTPVGTPRGVIVMVSQCPPGAAGGQDDAVSVNYGSLTLTEHASSPILKTATEAMGVYCFFGLSSIPTGAQTVTITSGANGSRKVGACYTVTAAADTEIEGIQTITNDSLANPSATLSLNGNTCFVCEGISSGQAAITSVTPSSGWTSDGEVDNGNQVHAHYSYDTIGSSDVTVGFTQAADDVALFAIAMKEAAAAGGAAPNTLTLLGVG